MDYWQPAASQQKLGVACRLVEMNYQQMHVILSHEFMLRVIGSSNMETPQVEIMPQIKESKNQCYKMIESTTSTTYF